MKVFAVTIAALAAFVAADAFAQGRPEAMAPAAAPAVAGYSGYAGADLSGPDGWRYRWYNGHWWYWLPEGRWLYWDNDHWAGNNANAYTANYAPQSADSGFSGCHTSFYGNYGDTCAPGYGTGYGVSLSPDYYGTGSSTGWGWGVVGQSAGWGWGR